MSFKGQILGLLPTTMLVFFTLFCQKNQTYQHEMERLLCEDGSGTIQQSLGAYSTL